MKPITLIISDISRLNTIQNCLVDNKPISTADKVYLAEFLGQIPTSEKFLLDQVPIHESYQANVWDIRKLEISLKKYMHLFKNIPGYDFAPACYITDHHSKELLRKNVIMTAAFAPTLAYNYLITNEAYEIHLKDDGTASFWFPTFEDAEQYPELYNFKGSWKEAYLLLIETLKKGWPMEEFPEELQQFLRK